MPANAIVSSTNDPHPQPTHEPLIGQGTRFLELLEQLRLVAQADCRVLLIGEIGSGKATFARHIHHHSIRRKSSFHRLDCARFRPSISQHPLQLSNQEGCPPLSDNKEIPIDLTRGCTLYLHEVGTLTPEAQTWLLRTLLTLEMESLNRPNYDREDQVRIIAGTSQNLQEEVAEGRFRAELFYRLNVVPLHILPLRHRPEDIEPLAQHFVDMYAEKYDKTIDQISHQTYQVLTHYDWPGNIAEMQYLLEKATILSHDGIVHIERIARNPQNSPTYS
ncbi:sigma 54-interacting transcriptional regulator [Nitrospira sp. M1]